MAIDPVTGQVLPKILVVEDDGDLLLMMKTMLKNVGEITLAKDGQEAYDMLKQGFKPDVIVTDVMMPRMDGITLAKTLKTDPTIGNIPLVMLTAKSGPLDMITGFSRKLRFHGMAEPEEGAEPCSRRFSSQSP